MPHTQFNSKEVAKYLHLTERDIYDLVKYDEIPHHLRGGEPVFIRGEVDAWASQRILSFSDKHLEDYHKRSSAHMHDLSWHHALIPELMKPSGIAPMLACKTSGSVIKHMAELANQTGLLNYPEDLIQSLEEREEIISTAMPNGFALMHPRHHDPYTFEDSFICLGRSLSGIPFSAPDGFKTHLFFLICCQDDRIHLHVLARLSMICSKTKVLQHLRGSENAEEMMQALVEAEQETIRSL